MLAEHTHKYKTPHSLCGVSFITETQTNTTEGHRGVEELITPERRSTQRFTVQCVTAPLKHPTLPRKHFPCH